MPIRTVWFLVFDGVQSLDVTGPLEVFSGANRYLGYSADSTAPYQLQLASLDGAPVTSSSGLRLTPDRPLGTPDHLDTLVVPGGEGAHEPDPGVVGWLRQYAPVADLIVSVCSGALPLAEAGLLDGRTVTTHWRICQHLAERFPAVRVDPEPIFLREDDLATSAGVTAGIDLALALVEDDLGRDAALTIARHLVMFLRRPGNQRQFSAPLRAQFANREPLRDVQQWITEHPAEDLSVAALAERTQLSPRQFSRAFTAEAGMPPGKFVDTIRIETARRLLEDSSTGIAQVARASGYGTPEAMRRAFLRELRVSPSEYRQRF
ncbi:AraC family transcriptional regulator with amidase-like domain [Tamaricihabitans halophyticus]|uniref:AraC family transcriptional regulator with amidase-like domain n=1 Tax=Tamaricihabitans halophyticus TaxID=1262583 RepID=A0A4R2QMP4_9PSEU|nr:GlxA family transcriptional regulator [Tamaricihabitans halophyticus]TCP50134.1 AraC family transcriptional regulator with amidase-like domain [Tamaricihabitans halophyticus]